MSDFLKLNAALQKVTQTGLIKSIDFEYESLPDKDTDVILHLNHGDPKFLENFAVVADAM